MNFESLADDNVLEICRQMDDRTFLTFLQTSHTNRTACLEEFRRRLLETKDPDFIARTQDPLYVVEFVRRTLREAIAYQDQIRELRDSFKRKRAADIAQLTMSNLKQRAQIHRTVKRSYTDQINALSALSLTCYEKINRAFSLLYKVNPVVFWQSLDLIYSDPELGPNTVSLYITALELASKYPELKDALIERYPAAV